MHPYFLFVVFPAVVFVGYAVGRAGHILGGHTRSPHHWLYGAMMIIIAVLFREASLSSYMALCGVGVFVSDLKDFLDLKIYGVDEVEVKRFWGID